MQEKIIIYEELSLNAHPALQTQFYDGWVLRFANGYTSRANSVNPLYHSTLDLEEKITECEKRYDAQGLPALFKLTDGSDPALDKALEERGYDFASPTYVMEAEYGNYSLSADCVITYHADAPWLNAYFTFSHYKDKVKMATAGQLLESLRNTLLCGRLVKNGATVACGSAVVEMGYIGLYNVVVDSSQRGNGYGKEICYALLAAAKDLGAHTSYLQVTRVNDPAANLYAKLGYKRVYSYWYRKKTR